MEVQVEGILRECEFVSLNGNVIINLNVCCLSGRAASYIVQTQNSTMLSNVS